MKPHPRIRKTIKWGGAVVTVLLLVVWIGSGWYCVTWGTSSGLGRAISISSGRARVLTGTGTPSAGSDFTWWLIPDGLDVSRKGVPLVWATGTGQFWFRVLIDVPLWFSAAAALLVTGCAWRLDLLARRRARFGHCPKCNYDRAGIAGDAKCPECGAMPAGPVISSR